MGRCSSTGKGKCFFFVNVMASDSFKGVLQLLATRPVFQWQRRIVVILFGILALFYGLVRRIMREGAVCTHETE
jgi:hypothetical protein